MRRNFLLSSEIDVDLEGAHFDLHNDFSFSNFSYDVKLGSLKMQWLSIGNRDEYFILVFHDVLWIRIEGIDHDTHRAENSSLDFMGYLHPDDDQIMDGFLPEDYSSDKHHLIFCFNGGLTLRIFAGEAIAITSTRQNQQGGMGEGL